MFVPNSSMVFGVRSTGDDPLRADERSLGPVVDVVEVKGQQFMKKKLVCLRWNYLCCNDMVVWQNSGLSGVMDKEEESTEEKQEQHGWNARSFSHLCTSCTLKKMKVQEEKVEERRWLWNVLVTLIHPVLFLDIYRNLQVHISLIIFLSIQKMVLTFPFFKVPCQIGEENIH